MTPPSALCCSRCGAPLGEPGPDGLVHCQYCGAETRVATPAPPPPPPPVFDEARWIAEQVPVQAMARRARRTTLLFLPAVFVLVAGVMILFRTRTEVRYATKAVVSKVAALPTLLPGPRFWSLSPAGCLVDGNGDAALDVFGMSGPSNALAPTLVDGSSGRVLWTTKPYPRNTRTFCLSRDWLGVAEPNFHIELFSAKHRAHPIELTGRDKLMAFALGKGCAKLETADGSQFAVKLPGGGSTHCRTGKLRRIGSETVGLIGLTGEQTEIDTSATRYALRKRSRGTPMLTVTATRGRVRLFSEELPYAATTFASAIAASNDRLLIWGAKPGSRSKPFLIGLHASTGNLLYALPQAQDPSGDVSLFEFNGRYVIAAWWGALHAYDPATGHEVWRVGR